MNKKESPYPQSDATRIKDLQRLWNKIAGKKIEIDVAVSEYNKLMVELKKVYPKKLLGKCFSSFSFHQADHFF